MDLREVLGGIDVDHIEGEVDPYLEAAKVCDRDRSRAWISSSKDSESWRLAGNVYARRDTLALALNTSNEGVTYAMLKASMEPLPVEMMDTPDYYSMTTVGDLPIPTYYRGDGGPYFTSGIFHSVHQGAGNLSFHRMMHMGGNRFAVRVVPRHLKAMIKMARDRGEDLRAVVSVGADPYSLLAGSTSMRFGEDELEVASSLKMMAIGSPLKAFDPDGNGCLAPEGAELILCGRFIDENVPEGPFVDITSTYDHAGMDPGEPVFEVDRVLAREDPIMHVLLPGGYEHYQMMGLPKEPAIKRAVETVVPLVHGVRLTEGGCCWLHGIISITPQKQGDGKNAIMAAFTGHPSMKRVIVVNNDIDIFDDRQVEWAVSTRFQADRDMLVVKGARGSSLDPSANRSDRTTSKLGLDATIPVGMEKEFLKIEE